MPDISSPQSISTVAYSSPSLTNTQHLKRKRSHYNLEKEITIPSFVTESLLSEDQTIYYFDAFFRGCDRFVPVFDSTDTYQSIRTRSSFLLNAICAVGCDVSEDTSVDSRTLFVRLKRWLTIVILSSHAQSLETVQALLV